MMLQSISNEYEKEINDIKEYAIKNNISEDQVNKIIKDCFILLEDKTSRCITFILRILKLSSIVSIMLLISLLILYNHPKTHNILLRNLQNVIYPGLRVFRKAAVPVITLYPSLTAWYDEWCLIENPYFQVSEMECWPCTAVNSVQDLTGYNITSAFNIGIPFTRTEKVEKVDINRLFYTYLKYQDIFDTNAAHITSNQAFYRTINDVMRKGLDVHPLFNGNINIKWRINSMEPSRKLRKLFPKLSGIPEWWSPSIEKFIFIDEPKSANYNLPNPECANVIIECKNGERLIELNPSPECTQNCRKLSILLTAHQSLWYNWWYWRPTSISSDNATDITVMHLTSFC